MKQIKGSHTRLKIGALCLVALLMIGGVTTYVMQYDNTKMAIRGMKKSIGESMTDYLSAYSTIGDGTSTLNDNAKQEIIDVVTNSVEYRLVRDGISSYQELTDEKLASLDKSIEDAIAQYFLENGSTLELSDTQQMIITQSAMALVKSNLMNMLNEYLAGNESDLQLLQMSLTNNINNINNALTSYDKDVDSLYQKLSSLQSEVNTLSSQEEANRLSKEIADLNKEYTDLLKELNKANTALQNLDKGSNQIINEYKIADDKLKNDMDTLIKSIQDKMESDNTTFQTNIDSLNQSIIETEKTAKSDLEALKTSYSAQFFSYVVVDASTSNTQNELDNKYTIYIPIVDSEGEAILNGNHLAKGNSFKAYFSAVPSAVDEPVYFKINGQNPQPVKFNKKIISGTDIISGCVYEFIYDGESWQSIGVQIGNPTNPSEVQALSTAWNDQVLQPQLTQLTDTINNVLSKPYQEGMTYQINNIVQYQNALWLCTALSTTQEPSNSSSDWQKVTIADLLHNVMDHGVDAKWDSSTRTLTFYPMDLQAEP